MKHLPFLAFLLLSTCTLRQTHESDSPEPSDYLFLQRAYPYGSVPSEAYYQAFAWRNEQVANRDASMAWEQVGPENVGGRITDVLMHPSDQQMIYAATASGGVWKSPDFGNTWMAIGDDLPSLSIGDLAIDPLNPNVLYCGTGEPNCGGGSVTYDGAGVFKTTDGGSTWTSIGLGNTGSIGRIEVDPLHPERIYVAAMGHLFENNPERGLYRSLDGGQSWTQPLFVNDSTGVIDLAINPLQPDTVYAVSWERIRRPSFRRYGGPGSAIWRSTDGGDHWTKLGNGLPGGSLGRMGIAIAPSSPNILYATIADQTGNFIGTYKSLDYGNHWTAVSANSDPGFSGFGWWFGQIRVDPQDPNKVYNLGVDLIQSNDGGASWDYTASSFHADQHALYIHPANPQRMVEGNDGGISVTTNGSAGFVFKPFPITQFYTSEIDNQIPTRFYGGAQDNGTWRSTLANPAIWEHIYGGDGFVTKVNPDDSNIWYAEYQYGYMGGSNGATYPVSLRSNWNTPYVFDPNNPNIMYMGREMLFKSVDKGLSWTAISPDLSKGNPGSGGVVYGTITSIDVSPHNGSVIWVGTDDGNVWLTLNGGANWQLKSAGLPNRWVSRVAVDPYDPASAYVCLSGFRHADDMAHIYKTTDWGLNWQDASGNLPDIPVNDLIIDPMILGTLVVATDVGVFSSVDEGQNWTALGTGLPNVPVLDLTFHEGTRTLLAATYGRSMYKIDLPVISGLESAGPGPALDFYPNPCSEYLVIRTGGKLRSNMPLKVWDCSGNLVYSAVPTVENGEISLRTGTWPRGILFVEYGKWRGKVVKG